jgi:hypothetical protein
MNLGIPKYLVVSILAFGFLAFALTILAELMSTFMEEDER